MKRLLLVIFLAMGLNGCAVGGRLYPSDMKLNTRAESLINLAESISSGEKLETIKNKTAQFGAPHDIDYNYCNSMGCVRSISSSATMQTFFWTIPNEGGEPPFALVIAVKNCFFSGGWIAYNIEVYLTTTQVDAWGQKRPASSLYSKTYIYPACD